MKNQVKYSFAKGDILHLEMLKPETGNFPICRTDSGIICLVQKEEGKRPFYEYGSVHECVVIDVFENKLVIKPRSVIFTAAQNAVIIEEKIKSLIALSAPKKRRERVKVSYPFLASYER